MQRIQDGRRDIMIHDDASLEDLPVNGLPELPPVADPGSFIPVNMDEPRLYPGDVIVGVTDGRITFAELIFDKTDDAVVVVPLDTGTHTIMKGEHFSRRFFRADEVHIYDDVDTKTPQWDVEFDESELVRPEPSRAR
ncbi:hypothetical protein BRC62_03030 [Halobacteriales archaeon QH_10_67_13]|nr:MAG: hypothetical protein BRC62_03030 [Halobacteriales archaeon QH_10_67_13]